MFLHVERPYCFWRPITLPRVAPVVRADVQMVIAAFVMIVNVSVYRNKQRLFVAIEPTLVLRHLLLIVCAVVIIK